MLVQESTDHKGHPPPPAGPGMIPLTVPETRRLLAAGLLGPHPPGHADRGPGGAATRPAPAGITSAHA